MIATPLATALAQAFLGRGSWTRFGLVSRARQAVLRPRAWLRKLARKVLARYQEPPRGRLRELTKFVREATNHHDRQGSFLQPALWRWPDPPPNEMRARWPVPTLETLGDLGKWLDLTPTELEWLADARGLERLSGPAALRHYTYRWVFKRSDGSGGARLLEAPKARTKALQRKILREILDLVPLHDAAHGFRQGRSARTHASIHAGRALVVRIDLADFFLSIPASRVAALFRLAGYPEEVAFALACLCTNRAPVLPRDPSFGRYATADDVRAFRHAQMLARTRHLPQGAPTSPALANLCAYRLDVRLDAAAREVGAVYTRYADDLVFSGDRAFAGRARSVEALVGAIVMSEGFVVNHRKTRRMRAGGRQLVTGLVVNHRARVSRSERDRVRAILHNCVTKGPLAQNREGHPDFRAHVRGLVAWIADADPAWGAELLEVFHRVRWAE